jgi:signal transduction histidine kinase
MKVKLQFWVGACTIVIGIWIFFTHTNYGKSLLLSFAQSSLIMLGLLGALIIGLSIIIDQIHRNYLHKKLRSLQREDLFAYLHDSVLQSLALIQNNAENSSQVRKIARNQEQDLRNFLNGVKQKLDDSIALQLEMLVRSTEEERSVEIEYVAVGDITQKQLGIKRTKAMLDATLQALTNAVLHGLPKYAVSLQTDETELRIYVRDHGQGFKFDEIEADRMGIRKSIIERIENVGGKVKIKSQPDFGTEVELFIAL